MSQAPTVKISRIKMVFLYILSKQKILFKFFIKKEAHRIYNALLYMARPAEIESTTFWSVARRSIQLSYGRIIIRITRTTNSIVRQTLEKVNPFFHFFFEASADSPAVAKRPVVRLRKYWCEASLYHKEVRL